MNRRDMIKKASLSALVPGQLMYSLASGPMGRGGYPDGAPTGLAETANQRVQKMYDRAMVIDGLVIPRGWDDRSFESLSKSGYTGFCASLASANLKVALDSLEEWRKRIAENGDRLIQARAADDFVLAKKTGKAAI